MENQAYELTRITKTFVAYFTLCINDSLYSSVILIMYGNSNVGSSSMSNDDTISVNKEDTRSITVKIHDIERQMLEGKLVLVGDDRIPLKPLNFDGQAIVMNHFPCSSDTFGTPNTSIKVVDVGTSNNRSKNEEDGSTNMIKSDKLNDTIHVSHANRLNGQGTLRELLLENGPWLICNVFLILRKWSPLANVSKEDLKRIPVCVKLYDVPLTAFMEDGLSAIATKLGTQLMLDTYTTLMCMESWDRSSFVRAMIDLHADVELKYTLVVALPKI
ncbi:RNA-directed DNA polymerase, eukaryota, reverse transcriptase zinc-binding domain protein [Tanacetum coccineum]